MATATAKNADKVPMVRLRHPEFAGLQYGPDPDEAIVFGPRAGMAAFEAYVPEDHPLLNALLEAHPEIQVVQPSGPVILYACPFHINSTFKTRNALLAHMAGAGHSAEDLAGLDTGATPDAVGPPGPSDVAPDDGGTHTSPLHNVVQSEPTPPSRRGRTDRP